MRAAFLVLYCALKLILCLVEIAINLPVLIITQCLAIATYKANFVPYSWADVHYGFNAVVRYDATLFSIPGGHRAFISYTLGRWVAPFSSFLVFLFFGLNKDAVEEYKSIANAIKRHIPFLKAAPPSRQAASHLGNSQSVQYTHEMPHLGMHEMNSSQTFADHSKNSPATPLSYSTSHQDDKPLTGVGMRIDHVVTLDL